ncbi:MAG TPA: calcium/sodium antiporter [Gemmatimonadaceae bacterium]|nr:calcium/sodium antiporter [Gemmatimonadaceae bacterium]
MLADVGMFVGGLVALYFGAEWLVRGAARLARTLGISALVIGLTIVAFGTSAPELVVTTLAALRGQPDVAVGNVVGSNIVNIAVILGLSAAVSAVRVQPGIIVREMPIMIASAIALVALGADGTIGRLDAGLLFAAFLAFLMYMLTIARRGEPTPTLETEFEEFEQEHGMVPTSPNRARDLLFIAIGLVGLVVGAELLVRSAVSFARAAGLSELVIGLTIVSIGTSLPELATSIVAALHKEADIAVGNVVGSNIFNVLAVLGIAPLIHPIAVDRSLYAFEMWVMLGLSLALPVLARTGMRIARIEGMLLLAGYVAFVWVLVRGG